MLAQVVRLTWLVALWELMGSRITVMRMMNIPSVNSTNSWALRLGGALSLKMTGSGRIINRKSVRMLRTPTPIS